MGKTNYKYLSPKIWSKWPKYAFFDIPLLRPDVEYKVFDSPLLAYSVKYGVLKPELQDARVFRHLYKQSRNGDGSVWKVRFNLNLAYVFLMFCHPWFEFYDVLLNVRCILMFFFAAGAIWISKYAYKLDVKSLAHWFQHTFHQQVV